MQMAYTFVHGRVEATLVDVQHLPGRRIRRTRTWMGPMRFPDWTLDYCGWPGMHCRVDVGSQAGRATRRPMGTWHLYAPRVTYYEYYENRDPLPEDAWIHFTCRRRPAFMAKLQYAVFSDPQDVLLEHVRTLHELQQARCAGYEWVQGALFMALLGELHMASRRGGRGTPASPWVLAPRRGGTGQGLLADVDAIVRGRLAEQLGMSISSLAHRFRNETGFSIVGRIRWLRVAQARQLLGTLGIKQTARKLGFSGPSYFSRVFKEVSGLSPQTFLQQRAVGRAAE
jgi:AraC-like DNA-binding protein